MSDKATEVSTEVQPDLFSNLPEVAPPKQAPTKAEGYDPMFPPGDEQFQKWDLLGTEVFAGPASD